MQHGFRELDDVALHLSGLMMVRQLRKERGADKDELRMYSEEIDRVRSGLAGLMTGEASAEQ
jgi:hypothetical protein